MQRLADDTILSYLPVVRSVVKSVRRPAGVDVEGLEGAGVLGLLAAFDAYDPSKGVPFESYARIRIRGAVQDELRSLDHLSRRQRRRLRSVEEARKAIEDETGQPADDDEISLRTELSAHQVAAAARLPQTPQTFDPIVLGEISYESPWQAPPDLEASYIEREDMARLIAELERLSEREQTVMSLYYADDLNLQEIGELLGVTQSRVCQILSKAKRKLKEKLEAA